MGNCNNTKQSSSSSSGNRQQNKLNVQGHGEITETKVTYKILILGDAGVGKTSLAIKWVDGSFQENYIATIGVDFKKKDVVVDNQLIKLQIWDTAGQERYNTIQATYYRGCAGIIVVYDITDADSFQNVQKWIGNIEKNTSPNDDITILLVGNKADLEDEKMVKTEDANIHGPCRSNSQQEKKEINFCLSHSLHDDTYLYLYDITEEFSWGSTPNKKYLKENSVKVGPIPFIESEEKIEKIEITVHDLYVLTTTGRLFHSSVKNKLVSTHALNELKLPNQADDEAIADISCGTHHSVLLTTNGKAYAKGTNSHGQLGMNDMTARADFTLIPFFESLCSKVRSSKYNSLVDYPVKVVSGAVFTMFMMKSGKIYSCGSNYYEQQSLPACAYIMKPTRLTHFENQPLKVDAIYCGRSHSIFSVQGKLFKYGTESHSIDNIKLTSPFDSIENVFGGQTNTVLISKFNNLFLNNTQSSLEIPSQRGPTNVYDPIRGLLPTSYGELLFNKRGLIELTNPDNLLLQVDKDVQFFGKFNSYIGFVSLKYMAPTSSNKDFRFTASLLEKSKQFKYEKDVIKVGDSEVIAFLPFIKKKYPPLFDLLHKSNLHVSEHSAGIIQNLVDYCFTENTSFVSNYSYEMILELVYFLEMTAFNNDFFIAHLLFAIRNQLSNLYNEEHCGQNKENQNKYVQLLLDQKIFGKVLPVMTSMIIPTPSVTDTKYFGNLQAIQSLFDDEETSDITLVLDRKGTKKIHCHKTLLASQSLFFEAYFNGQFSVSKELNVFTDQEDPVLEDDDESNIKTRSLEKVFMMFYGIESDVENELVISTLDYAHKYSCERIVSECVSLFERSLNEDSFEMVKNWLEPIDSSERTDVQNILYSTTTKWNSKLPSKHFAFNNKEVRKKMKSFIEALGGFVDNKFNPDTTTHYICSELPSLDDLEFVAAAAGNCSILMESYISSCVESGQFLEEDSYLIEASSASNEKVFQLLTLNATQRKTGEKIFASLRFHLVFGNKSNERCWAKILKSGGGQIAKNDLAYYATHVVCDSEMLQESLSTLKNACLLKVQSPIVVKCKDMVDIILTRNWDSYSFNPDLLKETKRSKKSQN